MFGVKKNFFWELQLYMLTLVVMSQEELVIDNCASLRHYYTYVLCLQSQQQDRYTSPSIKKEKEGKEVQAPGFKPVTHHQIAICNQTATHYTTLAQPPVPACNFQSSDHLCVLVCLLNLRMPTFCPE